MTEFSKGQATKIGWGDACVGCEFETRKALGEKGCFGHECVRMQESIDKTRGNISLFRVFCPHCRGWKPVHPSDGWHCSTCGQSCAYAAEVSRERPSVDGSQIIEKPLLYDDEDD